MSLKRISLLASAAAIIAAASAPQAQAQDWAGPYVGGHLGYASGDAAQPYSSVVGGPFVFTQNDADLDGWTLGGRAGYNWNPGGGSWVFGVEGDLEYADISGDDGGSGGDINGLNINWQASIRGRAGFLFTPSLLIYGTAGWAYADAEATVENAPIEDDTGSFSGWTYGIGGELAFSDTLSGTLEWRTDDFDQQRFSFPTNGYDEGITPDVDTIRVGLNWHF